MMGRPTGEKGESDKINYSSSKQVMKFKGNNFNKQKSNFRPPRPDYDYNGPKCFKKNKLHKKSNAKRKLDLLKKNEEYSHLVNSSKLTVFDWDTTVVLRNLPAQVEDVKKAVNKKLKDVEIKKFCVVKKTFKSIALVSLACVLKRKADIDKVINNLQDLTLSDSRVIVSRFLKPHSFKPNAFSVCIQNFPQDSSERDLSEILEGCGVLNALDVDFSDSGNVKKALVNLTNPSDLASLLEKNRTGLRTEAVEVIPIRYEVSIIVSNVHTKILEDKLASLFGGNVILVQKLYNMVFQIFFKNEESAEQALTKDGESLKGLTLSVRPWSKKNLKSHKVFVNLLDMNSSSSESSFDIYETMQQCGKLCSVTPLKKNVEYLIIFESKDAKRVALQMNGNIINGKKIEVTKKRHISGSKSRWTKNRQTRPAGTSNISPKKNHVYFECE